MSETNERRGKEDKVEERMQVLVVDDEVNILHSLKRVLHDEDFNILTASTGEDGLRILKDHTDVCVVISDQRMPGMTGVDFLARAKEIALDVIRIILTGYMDVNVVIDAINRGGANRYITKPWNHEELILNIRDGVEKYRLIRENRYLTELTLKQNEKLTNWNVQLTACVRQQTKDLTRQNEALKELNQRQKRNLKEFISSFANLIELRDSSVSSHSNHVAVLSMEVARRAGLSEPEVEQISVAANCTISERSAFRMPFY
jgi:response regulator RpfG family c-di-GMP phosphodiesterase